MSVIRTDEWLLNSYNRPLEICEKIKDYFDGISAFEIFDYFSLHGMYRQPVQNDLAFVKNLQRNNAWKIVEQEEKQLRAKWKGPEVPIFILPSNIHEKRIQVESNGKSGLSFKDKLFLFISEHNTEEEIKALLTHEYHHICRLEKYKKDEKDFTLLDTIIMEGLAEHAVRERLGEKMVSSWTAYYSNKELERIWRRIIFPNINMPKSHHKHNALLYGLHVYPKMGGYCTGYYLVGNCLDGNGLTTDELIDQPSEVIANIPPSL
ncbi:DUF2268 domain-containing protein [Pseudobacillus wudalianchiensis]|uniref:DUF2268 domain-containing protein n=1 Tax=Pseudobacillus wudalianchiensis TaxID=1743143 RepID=UPI0008086EFD|nr:DUF2268 domain-containing protein [Bacillus wudalianchiensis]